MKLSIKHLGFLSLSSIFTIGVAFACPDIGRMPDLNCDGKAVVTVVGDSLVAGLGDTDNKNKGGYVTRSQEKIPEAIFNNHGISGLRTQQLISRVTKALDSYQTSAFAQNLLDADLIVLDLGRNDRWLMGEPSAALRNIKRVREIITQQAKLLGHTPPLITTAVLMPPNRGSQGPWVKELNDLIIKSHSEQYPADLRFDRVSKRLLASDNIHPTSKGYAALAVVLTNYLLRNYKQHVAKLRETGAS